MEPATAALSVSVSTLGLATAVIGWSVVADRIGRVPAMAIGVISATVFGLIAPLAPTLPLLLTARLLEGVALGAVPAIALAYLAEEVDAGHTAAAAGSYIAGTTIGGLLGRLVAGPFGDVGLWRGGVFAVAVVCAASAALFLVLTPSARGFVPRRRSASGGPALAARLGANLRDPRQLALYAQGFLLMGGFVAVYNFLGFHLAAPPYALPLWIVSLLFVAYLAGTVTSPWAGALAGRFGRLPVLLAALGVLAGGVAVTIVPNVVAVIGGLVVMTAGFFAAHAIASGWAPTLAAPAVRAQSASLYYLGYYGGSSLFGWALGFAFHDIGWPGVAASVLILVTIAGAIAVTGLRGEHRSR